METFFTFLEKRVDDCSSPLCVELDFMLSAQSSITTSAAMDTCVDLIQKTAPYTAAYLLSTPYFQTPDNELWKALRRIIDAVHAESVRLGSMLPVILDSGVRIHIKESDSYAEFIFDQLGVHGLIIDPNLGKDKIDPFLSYKEKGVFLVLDLKQYSNSSWKARDIDASIACRFLKNEWRNSKNIGLKVDDVNSKVLRHLRSAAPEIWLLKTEGADGLFDLQEILRSGLRKDGKGLLIGAAQTIANSADAARAAAEMRDEIINAQYDLSTE